MTLRCSSCGALLDFEGGAFPTALVRCRFCGGSTAVPVPASFAAPGASAYRSPAVLAETPPVTVVTRPREPTAVAMEGALCPRCRMPLLAAAVEASNVEVHECACGGVFVDHDALAKLIAKSVHDESSLTGRIGIPGACARAGGHVRALPVLQRADESFAVRGRAADGATAVRATGSSRVLLAALLRGAEPSAVLRRLSLLTLGEASSAFLHAAVALHEWPLSPIVARALRNLDEPSASAQSVLDDVQTLAMSHGEDAGVLRVLAGRKQRATSSASKEERSERPTIRRNAAGTLAPSPARM